MQSNILQKKDIKKKRLRPGQGWRKGYGKGGGQRGNREFLQTLQKLNARGLLIDGARLWTPYKDSLDSIIVNDFLKKKQTAPFSVIVLRLNSL